MQSRASLMAQKVKCLPAMRETRVRSLGQEDPLEKEMATHSSILPWKIPSMEEPDGLQSMGSWRVGHDWATSLCFFLSHGLDNSEKVTKQVKNYVTFPTCFCIIQSTLYFKDLWSTGPQLTTVRLSQTRLSDFTFTFHFHALEKEMATHSSVLAWRIPGMAEPGGLPSTGSHRVGHNWSGLAAAGPQLTTHPACLLHSTPGLSALNGYSGPVAFPGVIST